MNAVRRYLLTIIAILPVAAARGQVETAVSPGFEELPPFNLDAVNFAVGGDSALSRADVFVQIPYERLSFVQEGDAYFASYELSIALLDSSGRSRTEKTVTTEIPDATFDETVSEDAYRLERQIIEAPPGAYTLVVVLRDLEIRTPITVSRDILLRDFSDAPFSLSGIMLLSKLSTDGGRKTIIPNVSPNVSGLPGGFHAFLEAYNRDSLEAVKLVTEVVDNEDHQVFVEESEHKLLAGRNQVFVRVDNSNLSMGDYVLRIHAYPAGSTGTNGELAATERKFVVRWKGMPTTSKDLDAAIDQLQYIQNPGEIEYIMAAETEAEKRRRFLDFWRKRDPTTSTPRNEKMEEYYGRIRYANKHFAHYMEGWRTDMGMVYIIFGAPNNVDRHPFDIDSKPYEVWSYYDLNHEFTFIDETGFGDYRLTTPIWEVWQRPR